MRFLPLIVKNALRNRRRSLLTTLSLAVSLCLLGVLMAMYYALFISTAPPAQATRLVTRHKVSITFTMPAWYRDKIRNIPGVKEVATWQWFGGTYKNEQRDKKFFFPRLAIEADKAFDVYPEWRLPEDQKRAFQADRTGCLVGKSLADRLGLKVGDKVLIKGDLFPFDLDLTVRGIYSSETGDDVLWFQMKYFEEGVRKLWGIQSFAAMFTIKADTPEDVPRVQKAVDEMFANSQAPTRTETEQAFGLSFLAFLGNIKLILMSICGAVTFTILLISANTVAMSVRERVREVGVMKTLGYTPPMILGLLLGEAVFTALVGGLLGLGGAQGLCKMMAVALASFVSPDQLTMRVPVVATLLGLSAVVGLLSAIVPAWNASRTSILDALRFTD
jgi:putative ABC transport system permease protein